MPPPPMRISFQGLLPYMSPTLSEVTSNIEHAQPSLFHSPPMPMHQIMDADGLSNCSEQLRKPDVVKEPPSPPLSPWATHQRKLAGPDHALADHLASDASHDLASDEDDFFSAPLFAARQSEASQAPCQGLPRKSHIASDCKGSIRWNDCQVAMDDGCDGLVRYSLTPYRAYNANPGAYLKRVWDDNWPARKHRRSRVAIARRTSDRESKVGPQPKRTVQAKAVVTAHRGQLRSVQKPEPGSALVASEHPKLPHTRAASIKRPEDVNFEALPDYCPSTSDLPGSKALKIEWTSHNPLDLSSDPHRNLLHEAELSLASTLRLSCATYLCSKRRIFAKVRDAYEAGKDFRKTDAQQACQIDVNKASKLWVAFERVGWFRRIHFQPILDQSTAN